MLGQKWRKWLSIPLLAIALIAVVFTAPSALASSISVYPSTGLPGMTFWVTADGFQPLESVATWVGRPDGSVIGTGQTTADESGAVEFKVQTAWNWPRGEYRAVARGKSGALLYTTFWLNAPAASTATPTPQASNQADRTFFYTGRHYTPGESVWVWYTNPNNATSFYKSVNADPWGNVWFSVTLGADWPYGQYHWAARGNTSKHVTDVQFAYFDGKISGLIASDPLQGQPMLFSFTASGLNGGEKVSIWVGLPNGTNRFLTATTADSGGSVTYSAILPPGLPFGTYRVVAYGWSSHRTVYRDYDYFGVGY